MPEIGKILEGKFARVGFSLKPGAIVTFLEEGKLEENTFDDDETADERLTVRVEVNGEKKLITPNLTSMRELGKAWGTHTKNWIGKKAKVTIEDKQVFGDWKKVAFFHPVSTVSSSEVTKPGKVSPDTEELILELEMCATQEEFVKKMATLSARINKLTVKDKLIFTREKQNVELRFSSGPGEQKEIPF